MADTNDLLKDVCASLLDAYGQTPQASSQSILAFEQTGITTGTLATAADAVELVSTFADALPDISGGVYMRTTRTLSLNYDLMLEGSVPVSQTQAAVFSATKAAARLAYDNSSIGSSDPGVITSFEPVTAWPPNWYDATQQTNWSHYSYPIPPSASGTSSPVKPPLHIITPMEPWRFTALQAVTPVIQSAPTPVVNRVPPPVVNRVPTPINRSPSATMTFRPLMATAPLARATAPAGNLATAARLSTFVLPTRFAAVATAPPPVPLQPEFTISFDYCIVQLSRTWLSGDFMALPAWYVPGFSEGDYSSGPAAIASALASNTTAPSGQSSAATGQPATYGPLTFIPTAFVAIKSLAMNVPAAADGSVSSGPVALGPFSVPNATGAAAGSTGGGIHIIGWICGVQPQLPPVTDPALVPVPTSSTSTAVASGASAS